MGRIQANAAGQYIAAPARMIVEPRKTDHRGLSFKVLHDLKLGKTEHKISVGYRDMDAVNVTVNNADNDTKGVRVTPVSGLVRTARTVRRGLSDSGRPG